MFDNFGWAESMVMIRIQRGSQLEMGWYHGDRSVSCLGWIAGNWNAKISAWKPLAVGLEHNLNFSTLHELHIPGRVYTFYGLWMADEMGF
jgi:hypothetical protein